MYISIEDNKKTVLFNNGILLVVERIFINKLLPLITHYFSFFCKC